MPTPRSVAHGTQASANTFGEVDLQVTRVGPAARRWERRCPDCGANEPVWALGSREAKALSTKEIARSDRAHGAWCQFPRRHSSAEATGRRMTAQACLDIPGSPEPPAAPWTAARIQQHGLADPAHPVRPPCLSPGGRGLSVPAPFELGKLTLTPGQFGGPAGQPRAHRDTDGVQV